MVDGNKHLRIDSVRAGQGEIGMTLCPGKKQEGAISGNWNRNLADDLDAIAAWGASAVVTVMTRDEFAMLKVPDIGQEVEARGLDWYHPVVLDGGIPDAAFEKLLDLRGAPTAPHVTRW